MSYSSTWKASSPCLVVLILALPTPTRCRQVGAIYVSQISHVTSATNCLSLPTSCSTPLFSKALWSQQPHETLYQLSQPTLISSFFGCLTASLILALKLHSFHILLISCMCHSEHHTFLELRRWAEVLCLIFQHLVLWWGHQHIL